ncbi:MAG: TfoX/Sxy family protein [Clostridia bacterium]|nr:TfoX/Sxy family protein [Clostridia bacterium]
MPSTKQFKDYVLEQIKDLENITCKQMMGEYLLYYNGVLFGGIYDDRFLIKITATNKAYFLQEQIPYKNAKPMCLLENLDDVEYLKQVILQTYKDLLGKNI